MKVSSTMPKARNDKTMDNSNNDAPARKKSRGGCDIKTCEAADTGKRHHMPSVTEPQQQIHQDKVKRWEEISTLCENLRKQDMKKLGELFKELADLSGLQLDRDTKEAPSDFHDLLRLLQRHRRGFCNLKICHTVLNTLVLLYEDNKTGIHYLKLLKELSYLLLTVGDYPRSIKHAEHLSKLATDSGELDYKAHGDYILGTSYFRQGFADKSQECFEAYMRYSKDVKNVLGEGYAFLGFSRVSRLRQNVDVALKHGEEFLKIARRVGCKTAECKALYNQAQIYLEFFKIQFALDLYSECLKIASEVGDTKLIIESKYGLGTSYLILNKCTKGYNILNEAHSLLTAGHESKFLECKLLGNLSYASLSRSRIATGDRVDQLRAQALKFAEQSLGIAKSIRTAGPIGLAYFNIGLALESQGNFESAIDNYNSCLKIGLEQGNERVINNSYCNLGRAYQGKGDTRQAEYFFKKALKTPNPPSTHWGETEDLRFSADYLLALLLLKENEVSNAEPYLRQAVSRCETLRKGIEDIWLKTKFNDTQRKPYQYLQHVLLTTGATKDALLVGEQGRARDFYDKFVEKREGLVPGLETPEALLDLAKSQQTAILFFSQLDVVEKVCTWFIAPDGTIEKFLSPQDQWESAITELCVAMLQLHENHEKSGGSIEFRGIPAEEISDHHLHEGSDDDCQEGPCKIDNSVMKEDDRSTRSRELGSAGQTFAFFRTSKTSKDAARKITRMQEPVPKASEKSRSFSEIIQYLSVLVLEPIRHYLEKLVEESSGKPQLLVIPQGKTYHIPFGALPMKDEKPLCSKVNLLEAFSFHAFLHCTEQNEMVQNTADIPKGALIVGNPRNDLEWAQKEAEMIANLLGETPLIGKSATHDEVISRLQHVAIAHFACHGSTDGRTLLLSVTDQNGNSTNNLLTIEDVSNLTMKSYLVVLSACHTARGEISSEGVLGLARAFIMAGAKAVVTALWAIPDNATKVFMQQFYRNLGSGLPVSDALSAAMCQMQEEENFKDVIEWGSFKVNGINCRVPLYTMR